MAQLAAIVVLLVVHHTVTVSDFEKFSEGALNNLKSRVHSKSTAGVAKQNGTTLAAIASRCWSLVATVTQGLQVVRRVKRRERPRASLNSRSAVPQLDLCVPPASLLRRPTPGPWCGLQPAVLCCMGRRRGPAPGRWLPHHAVLQCKVHGAPWQLYCTGCTQAERRGPAGPSALAFQRLFKRTPEPRSEHGGGLYKCCVL